MFSRQSSNTVWHSSTVTRIKREQRNGHRGAIFWLTGLSGSGKSTLAHAVENRLHDLGYQTFVLDGDNVRHGLCSDLGFSVEDRTENIRRVGELSKIFIDAGVIVLVAFISPIQKDRDRVRDLVMPGDFYEIYCKASIDICEARDVKGLYKLARAGDIKDFTGISAPYEEPVKPELVIETSLHSVPESVEMIFNLLLNSNVIKSSHMRNYVDVCSEIKG